MRFQAIILLSIFILPIFALATPLQLADAMDLSKKLRAEASKEKSKEKRVQSLKALQKAIDTSEAEYRKINPIEGDDTEEKFLHFGATLLPVFTATSFNKSNCEKLQAQVQREDKMGKEEKEPFSSEAKEALEWLKVLCK